jgi:hypothetical protein
MVSILIRLENGYTVRKIKRLSAKRITKTLSAKGIAYKHGR